MFDKNLTTGKAWFVTGTDTDVGKTLVTSGLLYAAGARGYSTLGLKPVAAGCEKTPEGLRNSDALTLMVAMNSSLPYESVNPVALEPAIAPHIAVVEAGMDISLDLLIRHCREQLNGKAERVFIEGAGGWRVPLTEHTYFSNLPKALNLPVILVVGMKLGCLNHALLTAEAIQRDGLELAGWVANRIDHEMNRYEDNVLTLKEKIPFPLIGEVPFLADTSPKNVAACLNFSLLD